MLKKNGCWSSRTSYMFDLVVLIYVKLLILSILSFTVHAWMVCVIETWFIYMQVNVEAYLGVNVHAWTCFWWPSKSDGLYEFLAHENVWFWRNFILWSCSYVCLVCSCKISEFSELIWILYEFITRTGSGGQIRTILIKCFN